MRERGGRRWLVSGCLALVVLVLLAAGTLAAFTWWSVRSSEPQSSTRVHRPATPAASLAPAETTEPADGEPLRVLLELDSCEVYIEPAAPGEPLSVEAHYDAHDYRVEEFVDDPVPGAYRFRFLVDSSRLITGIKQGLRGGQPQLRVRLPRETPIEFKLLQRNGGAIVDLSGLNMTGVEFDVGGALLKVDADERLAGELDSFVVTGSQGGIVLESMDLIQPRRIGIDFEMGQAILDFRGEWLQDTEIDLSLGMADSIVRLPRGPRVSGIGDRLPEPASSEETPSPELRFTVQSGRRTTLRVFE